MFGAISRWVKAVGYLLTGQVDSARRILDANPHVMRAKYDEIIRDKVSRIQQYKQAVAGLIAQQEDKIGKVKALSEEAGNLERLKEGALAKAKQRVQILQGQGKTKEDIQKDAEYQKCVSAYNDFSSTLAEKQERIAELETSVQEYDGRLKEHKIQLQHLAREIDKIKSEQADAVADIITSQQEKELADVFSGIAEGGSGEELQRMREVRQQVKAEARVSKELAGTDSRAQEAEFLEYARKSSVSDEFDSLVGLAGMTDAKAKAEPVKDAGTKGPALPE